MKTALITGITGQDGSYLAEFLLEQGYRVVGMQRRTSTETVGRIAHLIDRIELVQGDLLDELSLIDLMRRYQPDEVYNLAAQSFVPTSWQQPVLTGEFTALGVTRMLEAIRLTKPDARFYQASSSEMFGKVQEVPQRETTPFYPRSPYGVSKVFGHWITVNYRESYNLFACSGILFNHECLSETTPLIVRRGETVNVVTPDELVPLRREGSSLQTFEPADLQVWDGVAWTDVQAITATHRRESDPDHQLLLIQARGGVAEVTAHHHMLDAEGCVLPARDVQPGNHLAMAVTLPGAPGWTALTREMAYFLGLLSAEGDVAPTGHIQFAHRDPDLRNRVADLWSRLFLGSTTRQTELAGRNTDRAGEPLSLTGAPAAGRWLREQLYNAADLKRVPPLVLNGTPDIQAAYLDGYHAGNGQKARNGVETNSAVLAQGLYWLYANQGRDCSVCAKRRGTTTCYQLTTGSDHGRETESGDLGGQASEVTQVAAASPGDWVFDVETAIGRLAAGVGRLVVHNSPRRGLEFVTRKVTHGVARIKLGLAGELRLGNLEAQRDWGYAPDYVRAMWLMLQQDEPTDYVVATGRTHSVRRLCELAFDAAGLNWQDYVVIDPRFIRPAEVDLLVGDAGKARAVLGWKPDVSFEEMVPLMVEADIALLSGKNAPAGMIGRL